MKLSTRVNKYCINNLLTIKWIVVFKLILHEYSVAGSEECSLNIDCLQTTEHVKQQHMYIKKWQR